MTTLTLHELKILQLFKNVFSFLPEIVKVDVEDNRIYFKQGKTQCVKELTAIIALLANLAVESNNIIVPTSVHMEDGHILWEFSKADSTSLSINLDIDGSIYEIYRNTPTSKLLLSSNLLTPVNWKIIIRCIKDYGSTGPILE